MRLSADELREREARSLRAFYRRFTPTTEGGRLITLDGSVLVAVMPMIPKHSMPNAVTYMDPSSIAPILDELHQIYMSAGVDAWTVWVRPGDDYLVTALEVAGHGLDETFEIMGAAVGNCDLSPSTDLAIDSGSWEEMAELNHVVYGDEPPAWGAVMLNAGDKAYRYVGRDEQGAPIGCVAALHVRGDCYITFVATTEEARGRGVASDLIRAALRDGLEAGCVTTTLEATPAGKPVYKKLGYLDLGPTRLYERRR